MPVPVTLPSSFVDSAIRANAGPSDFSQAPEVSPAHPDSRTSIFTAPKLATVPGTDFPGIPTEGAPHDDEAVNVPSGNVTPTGQAPLPLGAQKAISEICDQYLRQLGLNPAQSAYGNIGTINLITSSSPPAPQLPLPSSSGASNATGPSRPIIPESPFLSRVFHQMVKEKILFRGFHVL